MPIKPENLKRYPPNWRFIRVGILWRAGHCCEGSPAYPDCRAANYEQHPVTGSKVILTIAHLDHMPENCDGLDQLVVSEFGLGMQALIRPKEKSNLRAWCQRCHLTYDAAHHAKNAAATRAILGEIESVVAIGVHGQRTWSQAAARPAITSTMVAVCEGFLRTVDRLSDGGARD